MNFLFYCQGDDGGMLQAFSDQLTDHTVIDWNSCHLDDSQRASIDAAIVWMPPDDFFDGLCNLSQVYALAAGVDQLLEHPGLPTDAVIVRLQDAGMAAQMSEYVLYGVLHAHRRFKDFRRAQQRREWIHGVNVPSASQVSVGVLGAGALGLQVAVRLQLNGYPIRCWTRTQRSMPEGIGLAVGHAELDCFLAESQVLVCLLPLTDETRGILNRSLFDKLPKGAFIINVARGAHVVDEDLISALDVGQLSGALLDVFHTEPLPAEHPFWDHPQILITPHEAANSLVDASVKQTLSSIRQLELGELPPGVVDRARGY